jgi:hypothetical protein
MPRFGPPKYQPLTDYLAALIAAEVTLTFAEIEAIVGAPLPPTARQSSFWSTTQSLVACPWARAGWRVARTRLRSAMPAVTFQRVRPDATG